jgi:DNA polymerase-3 subunit gamma/tau
MGQALYRKYRSKRLSEIVGQEHITKTLETALKQKRIAHAYLFTGPRGVGKTSIARILAHEINELPYTDESMHMDIIEIDAASNRRIDEIRDLRDKVHVAPTSAKYKVYIIDEVHMLTREAFNALLKTLEEPPAHVIFILATTEAHKLPITIVSRTQRFQFKSVDVEQVAAHLRTIAEAEHIAVSDEALQMIAEHGEGSFRDSISLLDQAASSEEQLSAESIQRLVGIAPSSLIDTILQTIQSGDTTELVNQVAQARSQGIAATELARQISAKLRTQLLSSSAQAIQSFATTLRDLATIPASASQWLALELCLLEALARHQIANQPAAPAIAAPIQPQPAVEQVAVPVGATEKVEPTPPIAAEPEVATSAPTGPITDSEALWLAMLEDIRENHNTLYGVLRMAKPSFTDTSLTLLFKFPFHQKRVSESKHIAAIVETLQKLSNKTYDVTCTAEEKPNMLTVSEQSTSGNPLEAVSAIFGDAQLVED